MRSLLTVMAGAILLGGCAATQQSPEVGCDAPVATTVIVPKRRARLTHWDSANVAELPPPELFRRQHFLTPNKT